MTGRTRAALGGLLVAGVVGALGTVGVALAGDGPLPSEVQAVRAAVARYHTLEQAERDGYGIRPGEPCVAAPSGTMGIHALNLGLMFDDGSLDPARPEILLYAPGENGSLKLVGVEYWKADADQDLTTSDDRPSLFGQVVQGPMPGHGDWGMPVHYDLHVWVAEENPGGLFAMFNPDIACS